MQFRILGPLEVVDSDHLVGLGGTRERATLGFLLLHANQVVASSNLIEALWSVGKTPQSARKILQNSVWRLRRTLSLEDGALGSAALLTQVPGYMLRVGPDLTDLHNFQRLAERGHAQLAAGSPEAATPLLRDALALWRGPVLADLMEAGVDWPELTAVQSARLDAMEDYFDAELACGRHHRVLAELEGIAAAEPLRERVLSQLMLALYRAGRQKDALDVYHHARTAMVEGFGLEPGPALKDLQQAILVHDPALMPVGLQQQIGLVTGSNRDHSGQARPYGEALPMDTCGTAAHPERSSSEGTPLYETRGDALATGRSMVAERKDVSVLIARAELGDVDPQKIDEAVENAAAVIREGVECLGGTVTASIGSIWLAVFGLPHAGEDDAERAVRAALAIRDRFGTRAGPPSPTPAARGVSVRVAVATGEALIRSPSDHSGIPPSVDGALLNECHTLLSLTPAGEIRVCDNTRQSTDAISYYHGDSFSGWQVESYRQAYAALDAVPVIGREDDLELLRGLLRRTRQQATAHLVTVLGDPGIGKTRFIREFERRVAADPDDVRLLVGRIRPRGEANPLAALRDFLSSCCGIVSGDSGRTATAKLASAVQRLVESEVERQRLLSRLSPLLASDDCASPVAVGDVLAASRQLLGEVTARGPVVVVFEGLHWADDVLVDFVENLAMSLGSLPVLVIATARPELLLRRPAWAGGIRHGLTIALEPISSTTINHLVDFVM
ncbi:BTAD domain-containing putative transcriptional regulator [Kitasatospora sp. GAS204B]|uniref:BTAD domain-containing putative transcriptional regulator n=1 Tax=unclassified Kitasatospora TaxID=2633591 RepID=UPI0024765469|nr:BTAD domain-containing putative transcriptional regulator [Kitasatospora sp. GAS204B]MDH6119703.1 DNA-binding SARP family transcriptional activator [Kitasatospora sp. GAS204B]